MSRRATLLLIAILTVSSLVMVENAFAQLITKPSIPEFTVEYVDNSYDIAPTYTTDPYTNNTVTQTYGEHVDNRTVVITIKNKPFTPFTDSDGNAINMFYNIRYKGAFGQDWIRVYGVERTVWYSYSNPDDNYGYKIQDYASQNTVVSLKSPAQQGEMNIQVEALQGYTNRTVIQGHIFMSVVGYVFYGEESGWSNTQTITLGESQTLMPSPAPTSTATPTPIPSAVPSPSPSTTPEIPEFPSWITLPTFMIAALLTAVVYFKKRKH